MDDVAIVHALFDALDAGDYERFKTFFTDDAVIWHNWDLVDTPIEATATALAGLKSQVKDPKYEDRRYEAVPGGVIAQHVLRVTAPDGKRAEMHAMMRIYTQNGKVRRVEEYFDLGQSANLRRGAKS